MKRYIGAVYLPLLVSFEGKMGQKWKNPLTLSQVNFTVAASTVDSWLDTSQLCHPAGGRLVKLQRNVGGIRLLSKVNQEVREWQMFCGG